MVLKTFECSNCSTSADQMVDIATTGQIIFCDNCLVTCAHTLVFNCKGMHYNYMSGWTDDRIEKSIVFGDVGATIGPTGKPAMDKNGKPLADRLNNPERRVERRNVRRFNKNKQKGLGKIYVGA